MRIIHDPLYLFFHEIPKSKQINFNIQRKTQWRRYNADDRSELSLFRGAVPMRKKSVICIVLLIKKEIYLKIK